MFSNIHNDLPPGFLTQEQLEERKREQKEYESRKSELYNKLPPGFEPTPEMLNAIKPVHNTMIVVGGQAANLLHPDDTRFRAKPGRPLKFPKPEILYERIQDYFKECERRLLPITVSGLALYLDTTRATLLEYATGKRGDKFVKIIEQALQRCESYAEAQLYEGKNVNGIIFALVNNFGWAPARKSESSANVTINSAEQIARISAPKAAP